MNHHTIKIRNDFSLQQRVAALVLRREYARVAGSRDMRFDGGDRLSDFDSGWKSGDDLLQ
jgi:hypothetical protein